MVLFVPGLMISFSIALHKKWLTFFKTQQAFVAFGSLWMGFKNTLKKASKVLFCIGGW